MAFPENGPEHEQMGKIIPFPERQNTPEVQELSLAEHIKHAAAAVSLYSVTGTIVNEESVRVALDRLRPPVRVEKPIDITKPGARQFYEPFFPLVASKPGEQRKPVVTMAQEVYANLMPIVAVLDTLLSAKPFNKELEESVKKTEARLPFIARAIEAGAVDFE